MACFLLYELLLVQLISIPYAQSTIIPTSGNATHSYYITSDYSDQTNYFKDLSITCTTPYCHMICDMHSSCQRITVYATGATTDTLTIECSHDGACKDSKIYAATVANVNLICDTGSSYIYGTGTCRNLRLNASHASFVDIYVSKRSGDTSLSNAYSADIYLNKAGTVTATARYSHSLQYVKFYAYNLVNSLTINCNGGYSCKALSVYATDMPSSSDGVSIDCDASSSTYSCQDAQFWCPHNTSCNISCAINSETSHACNGAEIYIPDIYYTDLNLECDRSVSYATCADILIHCATYESRYPPDSFSWLVYSGADNSRSWECAGGCCPLSVFPQGSINCAAGSACIINCNDGANSCRNRVINATTATSLFIECKGSTCDSSTILCPTTNGTSCHIDCLGEYYQIDAGTCKYASVVRRSGDNMMDAFSLNCYGSSSNNDYPSYCYAVYLDLIANTIDSFGVNCYGEQACKSMVFNLQNIESVNDFSFICSYNEACQNITLDVNVGEITDLLIRCAGTYSCQDNTWLISSNITNEFSLRCRGKGCNVMNIDIISPSIASFIWNCTEAYACAGLKVTATGSVIDTLSVLCEVEFSCNAIDLYGNNNAMIGDLSMYCVGCKGMNINAQIANSAAISCFDVDSCNGAAVQLISTSADVNFDFECKNPEVTGLYDEGSCYQSRWDIYGYVGDNDEVNNNLSISCGGDISNKGDWDCNQMEFNATNVNHVDINCKDYRGCYQTVFNVSSTQKVDLSCTAQSACGGMVLFCPYKQKHVCDISCAGYYTDTYDNLRGSCSGIDIYVADDYVYDYLDLECPSIAQTAACGGIIAHCETIRRSPYVWDDDIQNWRCNNSINPNYCCPYFDGTTVFPTETPTIDPTLSPTNDPTNVPSATPTEVPSDAPTGETLVPSYSPTDPPTLPTTAAPTTSPAAMTTTDSVESATDTTVGTNSGASIKWKKVIVTVMIVTCAFVCFV